MKLREDAQKVRRSGKDDGNSDSEDEVEDYNRIMGVDSNYALEESIASSMGEENDGLKRDRRNSYGGYTDDSSLVDLVNAVEGTGGNRKTDVTYREPRPAISINRNLGPISYDNITPQQMQILVSLFHMLMKGVEVLKHGRSGKPNHRILYCDPDFSVIYWRRPGEINDHNEQNQSNMNNNNFDLSGKEKSENNSSGMIDNNKGNIIILYLSVFK